MNWQEIPITQLIPQRSPFIMVDRVLSFEPSSCMTEFLVKDDCLFLEEGQMVASGIIENMAQSCAARMGCLNMTQGDSVKIGYIGDIRDCRILRLPRQQEVLHTQVLIIEEVFNLTLADVIVKVDDEVIAQSRMKIATTDIAG